MTSPLWAPWRMEFIDGEKPQGCVFCVLPREKDDRKNLIVHRGEQAFVILNKFPYNSGHLMVVPNVHESDYTALKPEVMTEMNLLTQQALRALKGAFGPEGYNLGMNLGAAAGAGIKDHLHLHIVPRWVGDTNFMPVIGETKCMPQHLLTTYDKLAENFRKL